MGDENVSFCEVCTEVEVPAGVRICAKCSEEYCINENGDVDFKSEPEYLLTIERVGSKGYRIRDTNHGGLFFVRDFAGRVVYWETPELAEAYLQRMGVPKATTPALEGEGTKAGN